MSSSGDGERGALAKLGADSTVRGDVARTRTRLWGRIFAEDPGRPLHATG